MTRESRSRPHAMPCYAQVEFDARRGSATVTFFFMEREYAPIDTTELDAGSDRAPAHAVHAVAYGGALR